MLKVVGASWHKTRISTYILLGAGLLAIGVFFLAVMERPQPNGNYCATIFWTNKTGFQVEYLKQRNDFENIPKGVARICYKDSISQNGWSQLELETQRHYPDWVQAFGAGVLEGTLSWNSIYNQWLNTVATPCDQNEDSQNFCTWLRDILSRNYQQLKQIGDNHSKHDHYWHQIRLFYYQLEGLEAGWIRGAKRARSGLEDHIPFVDFLFMNSIADIPDLKIYYENYIIDKNQKNINLNRSFINSRSSSMLVKIFQQTTNNINSGWKLLMGHSAAGSYSSMLRIQKRYKFRYHYTKSTIDEHNTKLHHHQHQHHQHHNNNIPGTDISFTGYPGILGSTDDFYFVKGHKLNTIIAGVAMKIENHQLYQNIDIENNMMPLVVRVMAANRLAQNRKTWQKIMSRHISSGCKQWLQIDLKKLDQLQLDSINNNTNNMININDNSNDGLIWIAEQLPGHFKAVDLTNKMTINGSSYVLNGIAYFDDILLMSGVTRDNLSENILIDENITKLDAVDIYLRKNAFRGDLLGDEQSMPYGNIDMKLYTYEPGIGLNDYHAISGPLFMLNKSEKKYLNANNDDDSISAEALTQFQTTAENSINDIQNQQIDMITSDYHRMTQSRSIRNDIQAIAMQKIHQKTPFKWSSNVANNFQNIPHNGHPDEWNFEKVSPKWAWID